MNSRSSSISLCPCKGSPFNLALQSFSQHTVTTSSISPGLTDCSTFDSFLSLFVHLEEHDQNLTLLNFLSALAANSFSECSISLFLPFSFGEDVPASHFQDMCPGYEARLPIACFTCCTSGDGKLGGCLGTLAGDGNSRSHLEKMSPGCFPLPRCVQGTRLECC